MTEDKWSKTKKTGKSEAEKGEKEKALGSEKISSLLFRLALPAIAAQIINLLYNIVDRMYIGHIPGEGAMALTGVGVTLPAIVLISAFAALIGFGGSPRASICMGNGLPAIKGVFTKPGRMSVMWTLVSRLMLANCCRLSR